MKKIIGKILLVLAITFGGVACLTACGPQDSGIPRVDTITADDPDNSGYTDVFAVKDLGEEVDFHTDLQKAYLNDEDYSNISPYAKGTAELSRPNAIVLDWYFEPTDQAESDFSYYEVALSENTSFTSAVTYTVTESELSVYNLKIGTDYYYTVTAVYGDTAYLSETQYFKTTDQGPRNLYIDGISNCRDLGGRETTDGGMVKQGLIYRTARLNTSSRSDLKLEISEEGIRVMVEDLGVKTEIDLRGEGSNEPGGLTATSPSILGDGVEYVYCPMRWNNIANLLMGNNEMTKKVFHILADEDNYPIFYHCNIGTDRTGFLTILIDGLLGVPEEELYRDYLFSNFGNIGGARSLGDSSSVNSVIGYMNFIKSYEGDSLAEKIYHFLVSIGVPSEELDSVISILKEGGEKTSYTEAVNVSAEYLAPSSGLALTKASSADAPEYYYAMGGLVEENITVNVKASESIQADLYLYLASSDTSERLDNSLRIMVNGSEVYVPSTNYYNLGCRDAEKTWVPVPVGTISLNKGENQIVLTQMSSLGANIASVTLVPKTGNCTVTADTTSYLPTYLSCKHDYLKKNTTPVAGETEFSRYSCKECGISYNHIEAETCEERNIQNSSNIKTDTVKLGQSGDWIEVKIYVSSATKASVILNASVSNSSSVYPVNSGLNLIVNGTTVESTASGTYGSYGLTETVYADIPLATVDLKEGINTIRINRYGNYGCTIDYIKISPQTAVERS